MNPDLWLVVGLGNPGPTYADHRHNVGHMVVDALAARAEPAAAPSSPGRLGRMLRRGGAGGGGGRGSSGTRTAGWRSRGRAEVIETRLGAGPPHTTRVVLAKPRSYMNNSGGPVAELLGYYKLEPERLVVIHDEIDLPFETLRLKTGGGDNGHNGLKSIRKSIDGGEYHRVRFGVGRPPGRQDPADFVLSPFSSAERKELPLMVERAADAVEMLVLEGLTAAQNAYH